MTTYCTDRIDWVETMVDGVLYIDGQIMHRPAFACVDVTVLWMPPTIRGDNLLIPGVAGRHRMPKRADETDRSIPLAIDGMVDPNGAPYTNDRYGLHQNVAFLKSICGIGTAPVTLSLYAPPTVPGGALAGSPAHSAAVDVMNIQVGNKMGSLWLAVIDVKIPGGWF